MTIVVLVLRRALLAVPMLFAIATATFLITRVLPGDPVAELAGHFASPEVIAKLRAEYGLDLPLAEQYWIFLGNAVHFDLGTSVVTGRAVGRDLMLALPSTIELVVLTLLVAATLGVAAGAAAALSRGSRTDSLVRTASFALLAIPEFWFALVALYVLFFQLGIAPAPVGQIGLTTEPPPHRTGAVLFDSVLALDATAFKDAAAHAALPVLTFGLLLAAPIARLMRSAMIEILEADYIRFGRSLGLPRHVLWRYAMRGSLPPVLTMAAIMFTSLIGGAVLVEMIFSWGGVAQYAAKAIEHNDYNAVQGFVLLAGCISVVVFLLLDLAYMAIDPRVRLAAGGGGGARRRRRRRRERRAGLARSVAAIRQSWSRRRAAVDDEPPAPSGGRRWSARLSRPVRGLAHRGFRRPAWNRSLTIATAMIGALIVGSFVVPALWPDSPTIADPAVALQGPSLRHPFGTDASGFDVFVRVFTAPRTDLTLAALGVLLGAVAGIGLGVIAGFSRGWFGDFVMRVTDVVQAFPTFILALVLVALSGNNLRNVALALAFVNTPIFLRLVRSRVLTVRELRFVEASVALGNSRARVIFRHVLPNAVGPAIVQLGLSLGYGILTVAGLAFLGVGVSAPTPEWGSMILTGRSNILTGQWWTVVFPGIALAVAVAAFNLLSEGIEQARELHRPRTARKGKATDGTLELEAKEAVAI